MILNEGVLLIGFQGNNCLTRKTEFITENVLSDYLEGICSESVETWMDCSTKWKSYSLLYLKEMVTYPSCILAVLPDGTSQFLTRDISVDDFKKIFNVESSNLKSALGYSTEFQLWRHSAFKKEIHLIFGETI